MVGLSPEPIDTATLTSAVRSQELGGVVVFEGVVRNAGERGQTVRELHYEAYAELALSEMQQIVAEVRARWGPCNVAMQHRIGTVRAGEVSVAIAVACGHRSAAFEACAYAIDQVKRRAAIWKQERYADGTTSWLDAVSDAVRF